MTDLQTIKSWFRTRCKPTEAQFHEVFDSFWHKAEGIGITAINGLMEILNSKAAANHNHDGVYQPAGNYASADHTHSQYLTQHQDVSTKADIVENPVNGNFAGLDAEGNLTDSGHAPTDFASANHNHDNVYATVGHTHSQYLTQHQDISGKASKVQRVAIAANSSSVTLQPNTMYYTSAPRETSLNLSLATPADNTIANEYRVILEIGDAAPRIVIGNPNIKWANNTAPVIECNSIYDIRICEDIGSFIKVNLPVMAQAFEFVDLGLDSGTLWATYNLGVDKDELNSASAWLGSQYAWGEVERKSSFSYWNYKYRSDDNGSVIPHTGAYTKYDPTYTNIPTSRLESADDAVSVNLGGGAHIPTKAQALELLGNTAKLTYTRIVDYCGIEDLTVLKITSKVNGNYIVLVDEPGLKSGWNFYLYTNELISQSSDSYSPEVCCFRGNVDGEPYQFYKERYNAFYFRPVKDAPNN